MNNIQLRTARQLILDKQMLVQPISCSTIQEVVDVVKRLGGVQYDPLPVVEQAHYLTLWNRISEFKSKLLDKALYDEKRLIEFVLMRQALHIVPVEDLPYYYQAVQTVFRQGWIQRAIDKLSTKEIQKTLKEIKNKDAISSKDVSYNRLRALFYMGEIAIAKREKGTFRMPYYSILRTLHPDLDLQAVDEEEAQKWLVMRTISAFGISSSRHIAYWTGYRVKETRRILSELENDDAILALRVEKMKDLNWMTVQDFNRFGEGIDSRGNVALLSPMDNLIRDRKWLDKVFSYSFSMEYFQKKGMRWQMSILYNTDFLGFIDVKMDRPNQKFIIKELAVHLDVERDIWMKVGQRIVDLAEFHGARTIQIRERCPRWLSTLFAELGYEHRDKTLKISQEESASNSF